jgi:Acetyltransferase (GNAT) domain
MYDFGPDSGDFVPFAQTAPYATAMRACGAAVFAEDLGVGTAQIVQRGRLRLIPRGPIWRNSISLQDQRHALRHLARWAGVTLATPQSDLGGPGLIPLVTPLHHAIWDLSDDARTRMDGKWRNRLAAAERQEITVQRAPYRVLGDLLRHEEVQRRLRGYSAHPSRFTTALPQDSLRLWQWRKAGTLGAAMAFVVHGTSATYHFGWAGKDARAVGVHNVMLWQAAQALLKDGVRWLDLGSVNDEQAPGLLRFKLGTGARLVRLGPTYLVLPG